MIDPISLALDEVKLWIGEDFEEWQDFSDTWKAPTKQCIKCRETLTLDNFYNIKRYVDGKDYYCKDCRNTSSIDHQKSNSKPCSIDDCSKSHYAKGFCRLHYERYNRTGSTNRKNKVGSVVSKHTIIYKYNIDPEWYEYHLEQGCMMCGVKEDGQTLNIDHDHNCCVQTKGSSVASCGQCVRGIVCSSCNHVLRHYDNGTIRTANKKYQLAKEYIERYEQTNKGTANS